MRRGASAVRAHGVASLVALREGLRAYRDHVVLSRSEPGFAGALAAAMEIRGFTSPIELSLLYHLARTTAGNGRIVEIGSYLGRSTVVLASGSRASGAAPVVAVDPHTGDLTVETMARIDTAEQFLSNMETAGVQSHVSLRHTTSAEAAASWSGEPIGLLFVDGLHTRAAVLDDVRFWSPWLAPQGCVVLDDYLVHPEVRAAVRELRAGTELRGDAIVVGKMIGFGPRHIIRSVPTPPAARLLALISDKGIDAFNRFFRNRPPV